MDRGAWRASIHGVAKSRTRLSDFTFHFLLLHFQCPRRRLHSHSPSSREVALWSAPEAGLGGGTSCFPESISGPAGGGGSSFRCGCRVEGPGARVPPWGSVIARGSGERHAEVSFPDKHGATGSRKCAHRSDGTEGRVPLLQPTGPKLCGSGTSRPTFAEWVVSSRWLTERGASRRCKAS